MVGKALVKLGKAREALAKRGMMADLSGLVTVRVDLSGLGDGELGLAGTTPELSGLGDGEVARVIFFCLRVFFFF